ncbi:hypothetical protein DFQ01_13026 [Paenibacillus cellulosilyticus]|uniref:DUF6933 domain-containing protein n=1 Tax=Paenibacillus cellulosilyticus TaxID=375489 RepID=A0A2V2YPU2_9BACL|nr:hypothetical protein [Paenibacillus cellulosilyticus]PWV94461.1 hypothetical protein DFQ01_13026 [Paenibacillus cellulosilyticus]QKS44980.1 hypothetical protein HUB94_11575 [Paenibacillus cellulosilyticus]
MITISCTKKLFELSSFVEETNISTNDELFSWHANVFRMARRNNLILMNNKTRYCFILFGIKKEHFRDFNELFVSSLIDNLAYEGIPDSNIKNYIENASSIRFTKTYDRSVLGSMTDMVKMTDFLIEEYLPITEMNILELNKINNHTPIVKLNNFPDIMMKSALGI